MSAREIPDGSLPFAIARNVASDFGPAPGDEF